ncbi:hypothetical protein GCM10008961_13440 [Deinococcus knuensis]|uniref:Vancomycin resistance protein n=1 Tax=Deinococcus knuensis TaxID=1837380 RepID=A0ABQ2SDN4_9DEIO|nr:hypothetical protein GCM10008961_13440 [Deinococcus knuensis]
MTVLLRWSVPEPRLTGTRLERPVLHMSDSLPVTAAALNAARSGSLDALRPQLSALYARIEARTPRDVRFTQVGGQWRAQARTGWRVDREASERALLNVLAGAGSADSARVTAPLTVKLQAPARSVAWAQRQGLTFLATGTSGFAGSPDFRVQNIRVGASRVHGVWVEAGAELNFNALVGPVTAARGFAPGYVISGGTLSVEDGGGLCQVSTTVFRAAFRAGLPVTERHAHSYQVGYYGAPGLDAAVYAPSKNLRWRNDTRGPVLVQAQWNLNARTLSVHLFGRDDGRRVSISAPVVRDARSAPDPTFLPDAALKPGEARRIDMPSAGAQVRVTRQVKLPGGQVRRDEVNSRYRAWGGVFAVPPGDERLN